MSSFFFFFLNQVSNQPKRIWSKIDESVPSSFELSREQIVTG